jgi:hypothetical protein
VCDERKTCNVVNPSAEEITIEQASIRMRYGAKWVVTVFSVAVRERGCPILSRSLRKGGKPRKRNPIYGLFLAGKYFFSIEATTT